MNDSGEELSPLGRGRFRVGPWSFDSATNRLSRDDREVSLEPKVCDVLLVLAERAGETVSRAELQTLVWRSEYTSEDLPRRAIYELRKVFEDDSRNPRFIETISRRGYRLVADVEREADSANSTVTIDGAADVSDEQGPVASEADVVRPGRGTIKALPLAALVLLATFWIVRSVWLSNSVIRASTSTSQGNYTFSSATRTPLTSSPGLEVLPAISPDGSRIAFMQFDDFRDLQRGSLRILIPGAESSLQVTHREAGDAYSIQSPTWSPDGTMLAFLREREGSHWIYQVSAVGGPERPLVDLQTPRSYGLTWSPDGKSFATGLGVDDQPMSIYRIDTESLERVAMTQPPEAILGDHSPVWSPDGHSIAFLRSLANETSREVHVLDVASGENRSLLKTPRLIGNVDWTPDSRQLVMPIFTGGRYQLHRLELESEPALRPIGPMGDNARVVSVARNARRATYSSRQLDVGIWRFDRVSGEGRAMPALSSTYFDAAFSLAADGNRVVMASTRSGSYEIWTSDLEGKEPIQLTSFEGPVVGQPRWAPDGSRIAFYAIDNDNADLWLMASDGTALRRVGDSLTDDRVPSWSMDGNSLYFASDRSGDWQIWSFDLDSDETRQVTRDGGFFAQEGADGGLYYSRWQVPGLWRRTADGSEVQILDDRLGVANWGDWFLDEQGIVYLTMRESGRNALDLLPYSGGDPIELVDLMDGWLIAPSLAPSADRQWFLIGRVERIRSDLHLLEGW